MKKLFLPLALILLFSAACNMPTAAPTNAPTTPPKAPTLTTVPPTTTVTATTSSVATISGFLFHDLCGIAGGEAGTPIYAGEGCVTPPGELPRANGVFDPGEPPIAGVDVQLKSGACPGASLISSTPTQADGSYAFTDLSAGTYCVTIDPLTPANSSLLIPGGFTLPPSPEQGFTVTLAAGVSQTDLRFGWDFEGMPTVTPPLGQIGGMVFHDMCGVREDPGSGTPPTYVGNCLFGGGPGSFWADGIHQAEEPGIAGVRVKLSSGTCPPVSWTKTYDTAANGYFLFTDLPAGTFCVNINCLEEPSLSALIPGGWTLPLNPPDCKAAFPVTLDWGTVRMNINFGWDYQFLP
jgi:hypothetical protein